jgi:hypothetical protein
VYWWKKGMAQIISYSVTVKMEHCCNFLQDFEIFKHVSVIFQKFVKVEPHCAGPVLACKVLPSSVKSLKFYITAAMLLEASRFEHDFDICGDVSKF